MSSRPDTPPTIGRSRVPRSLRLPPGARLLINGAGGGAGTFAIQMARMAGIKIAGVDRLEKLDQIRKLGAVETIDYEQIDFATQGMPYHRIIDLVATRGPRKVAKALVKGGTYWAIGGRLRIILRILIGGMFVRGKSVKVLPVQQTQDALSAVMNLIEAGVVNPVIDRVYTLDEAPKALRRLGDGKAIGKIVVKM